MGTSSTLVPNRLCSLAHSKKSLEEGAMHKYHSEETNRQPERWLTLADLFPFKVFVLTVLFGRELDPQEH